MLDMNFITDRIATGAAINTPDDVQLLWSQGVTHVIDCRNDFDDAPLFRAHPDIQYIWNGTPDDGLKKDPSWFAKSLSFALPLFSQVRTAIYCHCQAGINRGPSTAYAIMRALGFGEIDCIGLILKVRPRCIAGIRYRSDANDAIKILGYQRQ